MRETRKPKFVTEHDLVGEEQRVRSPFKVTQDTRRRFIRVEIDSPLYIQRLKGVEGGFWPAGQGQPTSGNILNISMGGVLVDLEGPFKPGDIVTLQFKLQGEIVLQNVLGLVKRSEESDGKYLTGVEFVEREMLTEKLSGAEMNLLSEDIDGFDDNVRKVIKTFIER